jgi:prepilin-type N-terminal cleavage/methylation domain-containing protein
MMRLSSRSRSRSRRGFTLVEVLVAVAVLGIAATVTTALMVTISKRNASMAGQADAIALATRLIAEVEDARLFSTGADPGLIQAGQPVSNITGGEIYAPIVGSRLRTVGRFHPGAMAPSADGNETLEVRYEVRACAICQTPWAGTTSLGGLDVLVSVYELGGRRERMLRPVRMMIRKEFMANQGAAPVRGW